MNSSFLVIACILFILAYFVGVKKKTWLLSGYNQQRVKNKDKLSKLVGTYNFIMGILFLGGSLINHPDIEILVPILIIGYLVLIGYVNTKMVEK